MSNVMSLLSLLWLKVEALYFTYGVLFGAGTSLAYNPSLVILGHYFKHRLGLVNGIVTTGSSVFTIALPFFLECVLGIGLEATMQVMAGIMGLLMICALSFVPRLSPVDHLEVDRSDSTSSTSSRRGCSTLWTKYINFSIWKNKKYVIWAIAVPISMLGYFVPYVHLVSHQYLLRQCDFDRSRSFFCFVFGSSSFV